MTGFFLNENEIENILSTMRDRVDTIKRAGGIALADHVNEGFSPVGYWYDPLSFYFVPVALSREALDSIPHAS